MIHRKAAELFQRANMGCLRFSWSHFSLSVIVNVVPLITLSILHKGQRYRSVWSVRAVGPRVLPHGLGPEGAPGSRV